jgi:hypothetical protein
LAISDRMFNEGYLTKVFCPSDIPNCKINLRSIWVGRKYVYSHTRDEVEVEVLAVQGDKVFYDTGVKIECMSYKDFVDHTILPSLICPVTRLMATEKGDKDKKESLDWPKNDIVD